MADTLVRFKQRSDTTTNWSVSPIVYAAGELLFSNNTNSIKVSDGVNTWSSLGSLDTVPTTLDKFLDVNLNNPLPSNGNVFIFVDSFWKWRVGPSIVDIDPLTGAYYFTLNKLEDVNIDYSTIVDGDILIWNSSTQRFDTSDVVLDRIATETAPINSTDVGEAGEIRFNTTFIYVCVSTNTWKRANLSSW